MGTAPFLTPGEDNWPNKLHVCCGGVYLRGYRNVDIAGNLLPAGADPPDYATTADDYYRGLEYDGTTIPPRRLRAVADVMADMADVSAYWFGPAQADKILCVQALEHLDAASADALIAQWHDALRIGGVLLVSVPDLDGIVAEMRDPSRHGFLMRHMFGSHVDKYAVHRYAWTAAMLRTAMCEVGFDDVLRLDNPHFYPAVVMSGVRKW